MVEPSIEVFGMKSHSNLNSYYRLCWTDLQDYSLLFA